MNKKKLLPLLGLLVLVLALFIGYKAVQSATLGTPAETTAAGGEVTMILERTSSEVRSLSYTVGGETITLLCPAASADWKVDGEGAFPLNQETARRMAAAISSIGVYRTLDGGDTGVYGFDTPACTVRVLFADGEAHAYAIGDVNSASGNRYLKDLDTGAVYTISPALLPYFQYTLTDLFVYDTLPDDIEAAYVTSAALDGRESADADDIAAVYEAFTGLRPVKYADWSGTDEAAAAWGIGASTLTISYKRAVTVTDTSGGESTSRIPASYTVVFGTPQDGRIPYRLPGSGVIYLADAAVYESIAAVLR